MKNNLFNNNNKKKKKFSRKIYKKTRFRYNKMKNIFS